MSEGSIRRISAYLFLAVIALYVLTGYGITHYRLIEGVTFGLLTKARSFRIHTNLIYPLVVLALMHLYFSCGIFRRLFRR